MLWGALGLVAVVVFVLVIWSLRPTPGVGDAATVAEPPEPAVKPLPDAEPVTR